MDKSELSKPRAHLESALAHLKLDDELDRLLNPRHTDLDNRGYLPRKVVDEIAQARREIKAALDELSKDSP